MNENLWPPPTLGMSADDLRRLLDIATQTVTHVSQALFEQCGKEGHLWGKSEMLHEGGTLVHGSGFLAHDYMEGETTYFKQTCSRCAGTRRANAIECIKNPFTNEYTK